MRRQISALIPRQAEICIFCALRNSGEVAASRLPRSTRKAYHASITTRAASNATAAARQDDDDADDGGFAMLKNSSARSAPPVKIAPIRSLKVDPPPEQPRFTIRKLNTDLSALSDDVGPVRYRGLRPQREPTTRSTRYDDRQQPPRSDNREPVQREHAFKRISLGRGEAQQQWSKMPEPVRKQKREEEMLESGLTQKREEIPKQFTPRFERLPPEVPESAPKQKREKLHEAGSTQKREEVPEHFTPLFRGPGQQSQPASQQSNLEEDITPKVAPIELPADDLASRFRLSGRFAADEAEAEPEPRRPAFSRGRSPHFDFDLAEAESALSGRLGRNKKQKRARVQDVKPSINIPEFMTVQQLAQGLKVKQDDLIKKLEEEGFEGARYDHMLDAETSAMFADIYGFEPIALEEEMKDLVSRPLPEDISSLPTRPPIVTIMGHVDHGKTTLLDYLRKSSVVAGEHGGITQHIGAFSVVMPGTEKRITFLDTPGHEAFLDMRRRGANVTDIVVLVVAADDSVKPQTVEAIKHALEAQVQIIVAINKVDKHDANIDQVKQDLTRHEIVVEDYGGDFQAIPVSGKTGQGMDQLEEAIVTLADVLDLRAEQDIPAEGQIIESKVTNFGRVATVLIRRGVLRIGDFIVAGPTWGRVRSLRNDAGQMVQAAYPGDPVQVDGWRGLDPTAGLEVLQADNEKHAKDVVDLRLERIRATETLGEAANLNATRAEEAEARAKVLAWEQENKINPKRRAHKVEGFVDADSRSGVKEVFFVIKADVAGSVEAIVAAVSAIGNNEIRATVIHSGVGPVSESDIQMLATGDEKGFAISFNQPVEPTMQNLAEAAEVPILNHNIIYKVTDVVKEKVTAALPKKITQRVLGEAEIGQIFEITAKKQKIKIAGCKVTNGTISRSTKTRVIRDGETVYTGTISSLKHVKKDVTEMRKGTECGIGFSGWEAVEPGDQVQCFEEKEEQRTLY